ncbi:MAG: fused MFS/spermidine synthase [Candidatus Hydrogenedentes bacterium]|nr:fused MFS/spermidine synthase [Candidatus Hydrogenedentota bacterium]NLT62140.1 fused MFS/spermidine synthase [Candidatus Hydrogenedentota bacterium]HNZ18423.1 fused MFS/spermidine synthase [Candidatus Hydrogenedentota bacterium]HOH34185.1 fused MFS/spermidine synthase [Candidatus Hydrogenedentota bacterium]HPV36259.1 fused MFS/spermidine synthase [Candidatus Hydrogenedentota bacterium]
MSVSSTPHASPDQSVSPARSAAVSLALMFCVLHSGATVMIYEFIAVRILQRDFGSLLEIWAAEMAVVLAGLAIGYALGGYLADRFRAWWLLGLVLVIGGLTALPMEPLAFRTADWLFSYENTDPAWWWPIVAAGACTFVPILALGTVTPQAIRLQVRSLDRVGSGAGWISSLSTVGSILGVMLITFVFLPNFGVRTTLLWVSLALAALGLLVMAVSLLTCRKGTAAAMLFFTALGACGSADAQVLFDRYSAYHHILVVDEGDTRMLRFDDTRQTQMSRRNPVEGGFEYTDFFHVPMIINPAAEDILFVGLGGGTGPKAFLQYYPNTRLEVAEIDPLVVKVAREFFQVPEDPRLHIAVADGRVFIRRTRKQYDAIMMDAYGTSPYGLNLPYHLTTVEFFRIARDRIKDGGCLVYNTVETDRRTRRDRVQDLLTTMAQVFEFTYAFKARSSMNTVLVGIKIPLTAEGAPEGNYEQWPRGPVVHHPLSVEQLTELTRRLADAGRLPLPRLQDRIRQISPAVGGPGRGMILTDDFAPTDLGAGG